MSASPSRKDPPKFDRSADSEFFINDSNNTEIIVLRHGETEWNAAGRIQGHLDVDLNDTGREQATAVAIRLSREPGISVIYSSDLKRALETAKVIANQCGGLEVVVDCGLRERNLGDLQGLIYRDLERLHPVAFKAFRSRATNQEIPGGGESLDQLDKRCMSSFERIGEKHRGERVVVVTHGGVIKSLRGQVEVGGSSGGKVLNTSISVLHYLEDGKWEIKSWGDVSHLKQARDLESPDVLHNH